MKNKLQLFLFIVIAACTLSCEKKETIKPTTIFYGPAAALQQGEAKTWIEVSLEGEPVAIGISFTAKAETIASLPGEQTMYHLQFPEQAKFAPFMGIMFDWNPAGHIPEELYGKPHFDFHFYMISEAEHMAIPLEIGHAHQPWFEQDYMPADYKSLYLSIPGMGNHWVAETAPEFTEAGFSKTLILGAYQDKQIFVEPMITLEYLQSLKPGKSVTEAISQFPQVQKAGYYPRSYTISHDASTDEYKIALTDLYYRAGSK